MGKKTLTNAQCLFEIIEKASTATLRAFSGLEECQALIVGFDWAQDENDLAESLIEHVKNLRKDRRNAAEREALRIVRLSTALGAPILATVAEQLNDNDLLEIFRTQAGGEIGRAVWMRCTSTESKRLFEVAESILNTGDIRGNKQLYDAYDVPCEQAPAFIWNDTVKRDLEQQLTTAMRLAEPCDVIHVQLRDEKKNGDIRTTHFLVVRFSGDQISAVQMVKRDRRSFCYYPARDATLVYAPHHKKVEVFAYTVSTRGPMVNVLSRHGFKMPLSNKPLNRLRYDLSPFARPLAGVRPQIEGARVEKIYLTQATALLGHASDSVTVDLESGDELHEVLGNVWGSHPFAQPEAILGVKLAVHFVFDGETVDTPLSIELAEPGRCSLQGEKDQRLRQAGSDLLEAMGVLKSLHPGAAMDDPKFVLDVVRLMEFATSKMDGFALAHLGIDIARCVDEGIITEGDRITEKVIEVIPGEKFTVQFERSTDPSQVRYADPLTGTFVTLPAIYARRWKVNLNWLKEELIQALGSGLKSFKGTVFNDEPLLLGELAVDGRDVAVYFAAKMGNERHYGKIDTALRLQPRLAAGILLTTTAQPLPFAGTNVVVPIEQVLACGRESTAIDLDLLKVAYRHGQLAAVGGTTVGLNISADGQTALLSIPGKATWRISGPAKIKVLQRLVDAYAAQPPHVNTKLLMAGTGCASPGNLFSKSSPWKQYLLKVDGARAWQLNLSMHEGVIEDTDAMELEAEVADG